MKRKKLTKAQRLRVYNMYGGRCAYCGRHIRYEDMQVDHMVPLYNGGADNEGNYVPACRMCNHYKSTYTVEKLREQLGKSRKLNEETQTSLAEARKSFSEYEKEAERKIRIKTRQRNLWIAISGLLAGAAIAGR